MTVADYLALARAVVKDCGPAAQASDLGDLRIAFARANAELLRRGWCTCKTPSGESQPCGEYFYQRPDGSHGWMCGFCHGVTQTG